MGRPDFQQNFQKTNKIILLEITEQRKSQPKTEQRESESEQFFPRLSQKSSWVGDKRQKEYVKIIVVLCFQMHPEQHDGVPVLPCVQRG